VAYVSNDGLTWESHPVPASDVGVGLAFGNGLFVGVGDRGHLSSADGTSWTLSDPVPSSLYQVGVEFAAGRFVSWSPVEADNWVGGGTSWDVIDEGGPGAELLDLRQGRSNWGKRRADWAAEAVVTRGGARGSRGKKIAHRR